MPLAARQRAPRGGREAMRGRILLASATLALLTLVWSAPAALAAPGDQDDRQSTAEVAPVRSAAQPGNDQNQDDQNQETETETPTPKPPKPEPPTPSNPPTLTSKPQPKPIEQPKP